jgi:hypothetical protein
MQYDAHVQTFYVRSVLAARRLAGARLPWEGWGDDAAWWRL